MNETQTIHAALRHFFPGQELAKAIPHGSGYIHCTFRVEMNGPEGLCTYLLQGFNHRVFQRPEEVSANIEQVHRHLSGKRTGLKALTPIYTPQGEAWHITESGDYWRAFEFISGAFSVEKAETAQQALQAGEAFGAFAAALHDLSPTLIKETIPGFHDSVARMKGFEQIVLSNPAGRVDNAEEEIAFLRRHSGIFAEVQAAGLPLRVVHNDAKIGNVLFAQDTGEVLAVIDWDTIMPGSILADFGDLVRSIVSPVQEDDPDSSAVQVQMPFFEALCRGFLSETAAMLRPEEKQNLVAGALWIVLEQAMRFLSDYLAGDAYYPVDHSAHNLVRAQNQLQLYRAILEQRKAMEAVVKSLA